MTKDEFREIFRRYFSEANVNDIVFILHPVEENKNYNSIDDIFRLWFMGKTGNIEMKRFTFDQVIDLFTWMRDKYPMWIDIFMENKELVHLYFSRRFRKPSELSMCRDRDIPPFRLIEDKELHRR